MRGNRTLCASRRRRKKRTGQCREKVCRMNSQVKVEEAQLPTMETLGSFGVLTVKRGALRRERAEAQRRANRLRFTLGLALAR